LPLLETWPLPRAWPAVSVTQVVSGTWPGRHWRTVTTGHSSGAALIPVGALGVVLQVAGEAGLVFAMSAVMSSAIFRYAAAVGGHGCPPPRGELASITIRDLSGPGAQPNHLDRPDHPAVAGAPGV
jgi:hypothetical protein